MWCVIGGVALVTAVVVGTWVAWALRTEFRQPVFFDSAPPSEIEETGADGVKQETMTADSPARSVHLTSHDRPSVDPAFEAEVDRLVAGLTQNSVPSNVEVVRRWVAGDPVAAIRHLEKLSPHDFRRGPAIRAVFAEWLKFDQPEAAAFAKKEVWSDAANSGYPDYLGPVFASFVRTNGPGRYSDLKQYLSELPQVEKVFRHIKPVITAEMKNDLPAAEAFIESLPSGPSRDSLYGVIGMGKAEAMGFAMVELLAAKPDLSPRERQQLSGAVTRLSLQRSPQVASWLETQPPDPGFDFARTRLAVDACMTDLETAQRIAKRIFDDRTRLWYAGLFLEYWLMKDFAAAEAWAIASDLPTELVADSIARVTAPRTFVDYEPRLNATLEIADPRLKRRAQSALQNWLRHDRAAALKWMEANTKNADDRAFYAQMIRSVPEEPIGPPLMLE
jgi:hypothetical protein